MGEFVHDGLAVFARDLIEQALDKSFEALPL